MGRTRIETVVGQLQKEHGEDAAELGWNRECGVVRTGLLSLDAILGGGFPLGRIVELFGREGSGKSTLAMVIAAAFQREGREVYLLDVEKSFDPAYARRFGVNVEELVTSDVGLAERLGDLVYDLLKLNRPKLVVLDSTAAVASEKEVKDPLADKQVALMARFWSKAIRVWNTEMGRPENAVLLVNQSRENMGPGRMDIQPGGRVMKHMATIRLEVVRGGWLQGEGKRREEYVGHEVKYRAIKSKVAPPLRWGKTDLYFETGFDRAKDVVEVAKAAGTLDIAGGWVDVNGSKMRSNEYRTLLETSPEVLAELADRTYEALFGRGEA